jgi:hypothetical protein
MYWVYFAIFIFAIFIPSTVQHGFYGFNLAETQELSALFLGMIGFTIFFFQEKSLKKKLVDRIKIRKQMNQMTKDLNNSYSYIGETNRKLDILEQLALSHPESPDLTAKQQKEMYDSIIEAIRLLGKSDEFVLRFICTSNKEILKEIKSFSDLPLGFSGKNLNTAAQFFESDDLIMVTSPKAIENIISCIIIRKKTSNYKIDDLEILKAVASQSLFFFMFINHKKPVACVTEQKA